MPPSLIANLRSGKFFSTRDHSKSDAACTRLIGCNVIITLMGASSAVITMDDDEPMCRHTIVFSSLHAFQNGSQCSECRLGYPSFWGFSENVTAWQPFVATRRTSSAISCGSHSAGIDKGMNRPGCDPHHVSMCQSL